MPLFRQRARECYFCLSPEDMSKTQASSSRANNDRLYGPGLAGADVWRCRACKCWNVRDRNGVIVSDLPAMHNPSLNLESAALRGRPASNRLPPSAAAPRFMPFCRNCLTNQTLVMNLLSNYLPDESDPAYAALEADLPRYVASLHERYPPVCAACQPEVDTALERADHKAQSEALGHALRRGDVQPLGTGRAMNLTGFEVAVWRVRGVAWVLDAAVCWGVGFVAWKYPQELVAVAQVDIHGMSLAPVLLGLRVLSILWAFWDPTWLFRMRVDRTLGLEARGAWVLTMLITLLVRTSATVYLRLCSLHPTYSPAILTKIAVTDALLVASAFCRVRLSKPVTLTLVRPVQSPVVVVSTPTRSSPAPGSLSSLSLGLNTTPSPAPGPSGPEAPIFGQSSMTLRRESDEMDWEATPTKDPAAWDKFGARQQRMFPQPSASDETGLESLIAGWGISPGSAAAAVGQGSRPSKPLPMAQLAPRAFLDDARVRNLRKLLGALRSLSLLAAVGLRSVGLRISDVAAPALQALLWCEAAASLLALVICLATGPASFFPLAAVVYLCDCGVRASALFATAVPSSLPAEVLAWAGPELACVVWAVFDGLVLLST